VIEVDERFEVPASPDVVWQLLADPYAVVGCVPGAAIVGQADDGSLDTTLTVKFGPLSVGFQARAELNLDAARRSGTLTARGKDKQGGARFQASATFSVTPVIDGSPAGADSPVPPAKADSPAPRGNTDSSSPHFGADATVPHAETSSPAPHAGAGTPAPHDGAGTPAPRAEAGTPALETETGAPASPVESGATTASSAVSVVVVNGEVEISGRLASMIEAGAGVIVKRMSSEFADCLRARCAAAAASSDS
jgi:carbon monoxide dehydrogenase subunit G